MMKDMMTKTFAASVVCGAVLMVCSGLSLGAETAAAFPSDKTLTVALEKGDAKAVGGLLDEDFQWIDVKGVVHTKAEALANLSTLAAADKGNDSPSERVTRDYGEVQVSRGIHNNQRFAHVWVKRPAGWRAFVYADTALRGQGEGEFKPSAPRNADKCENPCNTVPVKPANAKQQAALSAWQRIKTDEWHANAEDWDAMTDVDHITISEGSALPKRPHVEHLVQQKAAFGGANPGTPIISMRLADFGNVVVLTDLEGRNAAKPNGWAMRLFIDRGQGYKICLSIHTTIAANAAPSAQ
jgi:hypothetical protein